jgi:Lrp/AsnC family transcriptional regulator for asnA, asnC and gidA
MTKMAEKAEKLNLKDRKILYQLDLNARQSFSKIGKKARLSKEVVNYRITRLEKLGIIQGYYTLINMSKLGYFVNRFFLKLKNTSPEKEHEIIDFFVKHPKYWWVDSIDGFRDLGVASWEKTLADCYKRREELMNKFKECIKEAEHSIYTGFYIYKRAYLLNKSKKETPLIDYIQKEIRDYDELDLKILRIIANNARIPIIEIAEKLHTTLTIVNYRIKKMVKNRIIEGFRPKIGLSKIGYYWYKIEFSLSNISKKQEILDYCAQHPNIVYAYESTGQPDLEIELEVENYEKFREVLNDLRTKFKDSIESYQHLLWFKEHKILFFPEE